MIFVMLLVNDILVSRFVFICVRLFLMVMVKWCFLFEVNSFFLRFREEFRVLLCCVSGGFGVILVVEFDGCWCCGGFVCLGCMLMGDGCVDGGVFWFVIMMKCYYFCCEILVGDLCEFDFVDLLVEGVLVWLVVD